MAKYFPITVMVLYLIAAILYAYEGDWRRCIYWLAAIVLNMCITF
jgi:hypothetical protein